MTNTLDIQNQAENVLEISYTKGRPMLNLYSKDETKEEFDSPEESQD